MDYEAKEQELEQNFCVAFIVKAVRIFIFQVQEMLKTKRPRNIRGLFIKQVIYLNFEVRKSFVSFCHTVNIFFLFVSGTFTFASCNYFIG